MTGAHEFWLQCESHSCRLEQESEHQPQFIKAGAIKHMEQVMKWAHPGPAEGTLNIYITGGGGVKNSLSLIRHHALAIRQRLGEQPPNFS